MKIASVIALMFIISLGCSSGNRFDPTIFSDGDFIGITYTDETGNILGPEDPNDWNLYYGNANIFSMSLQTAGRSNKSIIIPNQFAIKPAYPNPSNGLVTMRFDIPLALNFEIRIINQAHQVVYDTAFFSEAGAITMAWDYRDNQGNKIPYGIYRVVYQFSFDDNIFAGFGDIWHKSGNN